jgi:site-specific recombinase XerD
VLDRILDKINKQDLLGKSFVEQYLRHKYRRNCKANTLKQAATSLMQFLSFFASKGSIVLEQLSREDIEAFVEALQGRGLKPTTVNTRLRNLFTFAIQF